jgi:phosphoribosylformimino-5-aminoimidazole carboxamide ribotide isomerase
VNASGPWLFPAVDLRGGRCVRLVRGAREAEIGYGEDPVAAARLWSEAGAEWIHAIDLGGALGEPDNLEAILAIARAVGVPVQAGGGLRDEARVDRLLAGGVERVILGTRALADPPFLSRLLSRHGPERIVLAMDVAGDRVRVKGWEEESGLDLEAGLDFARERGVRHLLLTAIDRDGTLAGPRIPLVREALEEGSASVVAAGGIGTLEHIRSVLDLRHPRLEGVVVGRALYEKTVDLASALALTKEYRRDPND